MNKALVGAALLQLTQGARKVRTHAASSVHTIEGVPIYNYDLRHAQLEVKEVGIQEESGEFDWVLMFKGETSEEKLASLCKRNGDCRGMGHKAGIPFVTLRSTQERMEKELEINRDDLEFVEPDLPVHTLPTVEEPVSVMSQRMWNLERVDVAASRYTGLNSHVYVMDTGIRTTHRDFGGRAIPTLDTIAGGGNPKECNGDPSCADDTRGHGTHVAGTVGGASFGAATEATLHAMKVCCGSGTNTLAGMDWIVQNAIKPAIMTMSLGSYGTSNSARVAVDTLVAAGVTVFVSAGNNDINACEKTYAFIDSAITVGSTTSTDARSSWSNWGTCVDIFAPGSGIVSASKDSDTGSTTKSGTSMATPLAAGVGAMMLQENPSMTPQSLRSLMLARATSGVLTNLETGDVNLLLSAV